MKVIKNINEHLRNSNIKPSIQRIKIFEYLIEKQNHPTVDMIFKELASEIPTLSKTTVYNTLKLFVENKIVNIVNIEDNETRYDADTSTHGHFKCYNCGEVYDFNFEEANLNIKNIEGFQKQQMHLYVKGICKTCLQ